MFENRREVVPLADSSYLAAFIAKSGAVLNETP
jgi:hypothetical protein